MPNTACFYIYCFYICHTRTTYIYAWNGKMKWKYYFAHQCLFSLLHFHKPWNDYYFFIFGIFFRSNFICHNQFSPMWIMLQPDDFLESKEHCNWQPGTGWKCWTWQQKEKRRRWCWWWCDRQMNERTGKTGAERKRERERMRQHLNGLIW